MGNGIKQSFTMTSTGHDLHIACAIFQQGVMIDAIFDAINNPCYLQLGKSCLFHRVTELCARQHSAAFSI